MERWWGVVSFHPKSIHSIFMNFQWHGQVLTRCERLLQERADDVKGILLGHLMHEIHENKAPPRSGTWDPHLFGPFPNFSETAWNGYGGRGGNGNGFPPKYSWRVEDPTFCRLYQNGPTPTAIQPYTHPQPNIQLYLAHSYSINPRPKLALVLVPHVFVPCSSKLLRIGWVLLLAHCNETLGGSQIGGSCLMLQKSLQHSPVDRLVVYQ